MHNFDRGIIKWLPFDALTGYKNAIRKLKEKRTLIEQPILSEDQLEILNRRLEETINNKKDVTLYYYFKGQVYYQTGKITKIDYMYKKIRINNKWLNANVIIEMITN